MRLMPGLCWGPRELKARVKEYLPLRAVRRVWNRHKGDNCIAVKKMEGVGELKSPVTSDMDMQFGICYIGFGPILISYFLTVASFFGFRMETRILHHCTWNHVTLLL